ncbi:isoaspartyl peptidase/L-asparaginase (plasmid) [Fulvitalea axinellae]|uniref:Isoaspartyl peptidase n=1 Tax=Fulvitalea axinellae TaxID=1182444 RepID=A0AAU9D0A8_9BACT|nr:isoaspartyl peptidase/L-asparaginase [Fulvitalea axinellae]
MKKIILLIFALCLSVSVWAQKKNNFVIAIHGGAGNIKPKFFTPEKKKQYEDKMREALDVGYKILENGGTSLEAVRSTINVLEDSPLFNAGKGAVLTSEGVPSLDASIMDGKTLNAGAVAGVSSVKNPIDAAWQVMENSEHVMLSGKGADEFSKIRGLETVPAFYFYTPRMQKRWSSIHAKKVKQSNKLKKDSYDKHGTVGAVALDKHGNLAAGTSTGGMMYKKFGRIGDSPVIGAGTYANNKTCAVSCTGHGEYFIRSAVAYDISARMEYLNEGLQTASDQVINNRMGKLGGTGGVVSLDKDGRVAFSFNTSGMFRGYKSSNGTFQTLLFK